MISASVSELQTALKNAKTKYLRDEEQLRDANAVLVCSHGDYDNRQAVLLDLERRLQHEESEKSSCTGLISQISMNLDFMQTTLQKYSDALDESKKELDRCRAECSDREKLLQKSRTSTLSRLFRTHILRPCCYR